MKKIIYSILIPVLFFYGCSSGENRRNEISDKIEISIEQSGNTVDITDDTAELRRTAFSINFKFTQPDSILLNASFNGETFNNARAGLPLNELAGFKNTGIAEELFNKDSVLYVSYDSPNYWYYVDETDHRFSSVTISDSGLNCRRDISGIVDLDGNGEKTDLIKIKQKELYLVIIKSEWNEDYTRLIEKNRKVIKIKFII